MGCLYFYMYFGKIQKIKKLSFFNSISMSRRLYRGSRYFVLGIVSFILLSNLIPLLEENSINCSDGIVSCYSLVDLLLNVSLILILVGAVKLILFLWQDYKIIEKYREFEVKYLGKKPQDKKQEKVRGRCYMCGTINDVDAVYCKKCATSLNEMDEETFTPSL